MVKQDGVIYLLFLYKISRSYLSLRAICRSLLDHSFQHAKKVLLSAFPRWNNNNNTKPCRQGTEGIVKTSLAQHVLAIGHRTASLSSVDAIYMLYRMLKVATRPSEYR